MDARWLGMSPDMVPGAMGQALPPHLRPAWWFIVRGQLDRVQEAQAELVTRWIDQHGPGLGFLAPSAAERARALGLEA
eukprot:210568-Alexandrium_andersonii.AAC.1